MSTKHQEQLPSQGQAAANSSAEPPVRNDHLSPRRQHKLMAYGAIVSIVGALILFFSWSIRNTIYQQYAQLKLSIQTAEGTFRLYSTLHEMRNSINSLAMETVQEKHGTHASRFRSGIASDPVINDARREFDLTRLSAHQLTELMDFAAKTIDLSNSLGRESPTHLQILSVTRQIESLRDAVAVKEAAAEAENAIPIDQLHTKLFPAINDYVDYWRNEAVHRMPELFPRIVELSNKRLIEARETLEAAKWRSAVADKAAFYLYVLGSLLALGGQALEKLLKART